MWSKKQHEKFIEEIKSEIKSTVNGKIDGVDRKLTDYIAEDTKWKEESQSAIDNMKNLTGTGRFAMSLSLGITAVIGAIFAIKKLFNL